MNSNQERQFFEEVYQFLKKRYGEENIINATVHYDEGKLEKVKNRWGGYEYDRDGNIKQQLVLGKPHLHSNFIPVVKDNNSKHIQKEKICANNVLTRRELKRFHGDLQKHLDRVGIKCRVLNGKTKEQGRNYTVEELKERYEIKKN